MNSLLALYAGDLSGEASEPLIDGKNSLTLALERSCLFPGVSKVVILTLPEGGTCSSAIAIPDTALPHSLISAPGKWSVKSLLETLASCSEGFDLTYFVRADWPFLDPVLAGKLSERHLRYAAEYSYADGWPLGLTPEILSPGTAAILAKILGEDDGGPVKHDSIFSVLQKDINAFDIETEISSVDLRCHRLNLSADSKRNLLLLQRFAEAAGGTVPDAAAVERIIAEQQDLLRTLPAFFPVQVFGGCPQKCAICPWPEISETAVTERRDYMEAARFESLLDKITAFSGDAVIDLSLWGELALHPQKTELIEAVLRRPGLALVIETSGIGWKDSELEHYAQLAHSAAERKNSRRPLSWIVSLDTADPARYKEIRGAGFAEAQECAKKLFSLFPADTYVQAVRTAGAEDDIEKFYRSWKEIVPNVANIIIQKHNDFCGLLPRRQASDLSPVKREPCWHLMRDMPVLLDGTVPMCVSRNGASRSGITLGNVFTDSLDAIWEKGKPSFSEQCKKNYESPCAGCDEYYTYNF